ncbi:MAG: patatin-like phospholipase family protein, partial [Gammaproteobacteria bacterium]
ITPGAAAMWLAALDDALRLAQPGPKRGRLPHHHLRRTGAAAPADIARLARLALGRATGIVLSGGGARGFAHLGVLRALEEAGTVIDCVAGASIGAIMGASHAQEWPYEQRLATFRRTFADSDPLGDYTLPRVSLVRGRRVSERLQSGFGEADILDLPLPFCCISADLDAGAARQHRSGLLWRALRASCAIPGVMPPVVGEGEMLVDGSVIDNFPIDALRDRRPARLIGVDISAEMRIADHSDSTHAPAWWDLAGWRDYRRSVPGLAQILVGAAMVGSRSAKASARGAVQLLIEPPLPGIGLLDWRAFDRIVEAGYAYGREVMGRV